MISYNKNEYLRPFGIQIQHVFSFNDGKIENYYFQDHDNFLYK